MVEEDTEKSFRYLINASKGPAILVVDLVRNLSSNPEQALVILMLAEQIVRYVSRKEKSDKDRAELDEAFNQLRSLLVDATGELEIMKACGLHPSDTPPAQA